MNTPARSPLGAFYRSPLGVLTQSGWDVALMGDYNLGSDGRANTVLYTKTGSKIKRIQVESAYTSIYYVQKDSSGNFIFSGYEEFWNGSSWVTRSIFKCDKNGKPIWGDTFNQYKDAYGLALDSNDNVYAVFDDSYTPGTGLSALTIFDKDGTELDHTLATLETFTVTGGFTGVSVDADKNLAITGGQVLNKTGDRSSRTQNDITKDEEYSLAVWDSDRNLLWYYGYHWTEYMMLYGSWVLYDYGGGDYGSFICCVFDKDGNLYGVARTTNYDVGTNYWLVKFNSTGVIHWVRDCGLGEVLATDNAGSIYVAGSVSTIDGKTTYKFSSDGTLLWSASHGKTVYDIKVDKTGNVYTVGGSLDGPDEYDATRLRKYSASGELLWTRGFEAWPRYYAAYCVALAK